MAEERSTSMLGMDPSQGVHVHGAAALQIRRCRVESVSVLGTWLVCKITCGILCKARRLS